MVALNSGFNGGLSMLEVEKNGTVVFRGDKKECISYLRNNGAKNLRDDDPLLIVGHFATMYGFSVYIR